MAPPDGVKRPLCDVLVIIYHDAGYSECCGAAAERLKVPVCGRRVERLGAALSSQGADEQIQRPGHPADQPNAGQQKPKAGQTNITNTNPF